MSKPFTHNFGFTLTELAVVLVIVTLLISGLLLPIGAQDNIQKNITVRKSMDEIRDALIAFAVINKRLPCPAAFSVTDPNDVNYGKEDTSQCLTEGYLPWKTLGIGAYDEWGSPRTSSTDPFVGFWHYRADSGFSAAGTIINAQTTTSNSLAIQNATSVISDANSIVAIVYSTGSNKTADGANGIVDTTYQAGENSTTFDDMVIWISRPVLIGRMLSAGAL